jgi:hypothetical protein
MSSGATTWTEPRRWRRPVLVGLTGLIVVLGVAIGVARYGAYVRADQVGIDLSLFKTFAERWLETGSMYTPAQLAGPFDPQPEGLRPFTTVPALYPPPTILLFLPFLWLPAPLWWILPLGFLAFALWRFHPSDWTWPVMALALLSPEVPSMLISGSTNLWITAFLAGALLYSWPGVLILIKPSLLPLALVGVRHRSWWIAFALWCAVSIVMLGQWLAYLTVMQNIQAGLLFGIGALPLLLVPVVAWFGRDRTRDRRSATA